MLHSSSLRRLKKKNATTMNQRTVGMGRDLYEENNLTYFQKSKFFSFQEYKLFAYLYHKLAISKMNMSMEKDQKLTSSEYYSKTVSTIRS